MTRPQPSPTAPTVLADGPVWRRTVRSGLDTVFGPLPIDPSADPGDPGLCGPGSASWRVIADTAAIAGGFRALLVQLLHPQAMAGVYDHSAFRTDPLGRLRRTSAYVLTSTFGSTREVIAVSRVVRRTHRVVHGTAPDGRPYAAGDPHLLAWVSVALTSSFLAADAAYAADPVDAATADAFVAEQSRLAALLDPRVDLDALEADPHAADALRRGDVALPLLDEGRLPQSTAQLDDVLAGYQGELGMNAQGVEGMRFLLWPPVPPAMKVAYMPLLAGALSTIDPRWRAMFGPKANRLASPVAAANTRMLLGLLRRLRGTSPILAAAVERAGARSDTA